MFIEDHAMLLIARERMEDASRSAEQRRALRIARAPRRATRVRLGLTLVRLGHWIMGHSFPVPSATHETRQRC